MSAVTKLMTAGGGGVALTPASSIASDVTVQIASENCTLTPIVQGTAQASTSGTSIDFTGIPAWVKRITVMFNAVSTNGSSDYVARLGTSGGIETTSYVATQSNLSATTTVQWTSGFGLTGGTSSSTSIQGSLVITLLGSNTWTATFNGAYASGAGSYGAGAKTLSGTLDRIRITTAGGTDTFDAGSINILYE